MSHRKQLIKVIAAQSASSASSTNAVETEVLMNKKNKLPKEFISASKFYLAVNISSKEHVKVIFQHNK